MHRRSFSNSFRVNIASSPVSAHSSPSNPYRGKASALSEKFSGSVDPFDAGYGSTVPPRRRNSAPNGPGAAVGSFFVGRGGRLRKGRVTGAVVCLALVYWAWQRVSSSSRAWQFVPDDLTRPPAVPKLVLERLRLLEESLGGPDDGEEDVRGWGMAAKPASTVASRMAEDLDVVRFGDPPTVFAIPEPVRYPKQPLPQPPLPAELVPAPMLDGSVCPAQTSLGLPCAFIVPGFVGEQETKAQQHLHQLGLLALHLNRTLVLPNVSKSRMGTCYTYPFDFYYDPQSLTDLGIPAVTFSAFVDWTLRRDPSPTAQLVSVMAGKPAYPSGAIEIDPSSQDGVLPHKPERNFCLNRGRTRLSFARHSPISIWGPERWHQSEESRIGYGESIVKTLVGDDALKSSWRSHPEGESPPTQQPLGAEPDAEEGAGSNEPRAPDVLIVNYEIRHPILSSFETPSPLASASPSRLIQPRPFAHFPYASTWIRLAGFLSSRLTPYVAVHWRQETLDPGMLSPCASALVAKLIEIKRTNPDIETFYLATDYPLEDLEDGREGIVAHSGTFAKLLTPTHHVAMRRFLVEVAEAAEEGAGMKMTTFAREQKGLVLPSDLASELLAGLPPVPAPVTPGIPSSESEPEDAVAAALKDLDPGLWGIVDKAVAMRASVFVSGQPDVCAKESSFTRQIVETRRAVMEAYREGDQGMRTSNARPRNVVTYWGEAEGQSGSLSDE